MNMKFGTKAALALAIGALLAPLATAQTRFSYSGDGSEVIHDATGLVWRRCAEGMVWSGVTCIGVARRMTHEQALAHARAQVGWRLPNVKELMSIVDRSRANPSINVEAFPATPQDSSFWSSSPWVNNPDLALAVHFGYGYAGNFSRGGSFDVRLVRTSQ